MSRTISEIAEVPGVEMFLESQRGALSERRLSLLPDAAEDELIRVLVFSISFLFLVAAISICGFPGLRDFEREKAGLRRVYPMA
jgi:hypothetical protein